MADVTFRDFINNFRNVGGAQEVIAKINFQEELFNLEQSGKPLPNRSGRFKPPPTARCKYSYSLIEKLRFTILRIEIQKTACCDYGLFTHISEIKKYLGIDIGIVPTISGFNMQKHDDRHKLWAHALAIYGSSKLPFSLKTSTRRPDVPKLSGTSVLNVFAYVQSYLMLPNTIYRNLMHT